MEIHTLLAAIMTAIRVTVPRWRLGNEKRDVALSMSTAARAERAQQPP